MGVDFYDTCSLKNHGIFIICPLSILLLLPSQRHAGKFFIYEHYDLSSLVILSFLCKLFEAALKVLKI